MSDLRLSLGLWSFGVVFLPQGGGLGGQIGVVGLEATRAEYVSARGQRTCTNKSSNDTGVGRKFAHAQGVVADGEGGRVRRLTLDGSFADLTASRFLRRSVPNSQTLDRRFTDREL